MNSNRSKNWSRIGVTMAVFAAGTCLAQNEQQMTQPKPVDATVRVGAPHAAPGNAQAPAAGNQQPEAKALLEKSRDLLAAAKSLEFDVFAPQIGLMGGDRSPKNVKAHMTLVRNDTGGWTMRMTGNGMVAKETTPSEFDVLWDKQSITWVDNQAKTVYTRPFGQARGLKSLQMINGLRMPSVTGDRPLGEELSQTFIQMNGTDDVAGEKCDVVICGTALEGNGNRKKVWIAQSDSLPRKIENIIDSKLINASTSLEISNLKVNQTIPPEKIAVATPDGYAVDKAEAPKPQMAKLDKLSVPDFEIAAIDGTKVSKASLAGTVAVVQFWGTWSNPSKRSHAELQQLADSYKDKGVKFFLASVREKDPEAVKGYIKEASIGLPVLVEADSLAERLDVQSVPTVVVMGADGANVKMVSNYLKDATMKEIGEGIETALKEAADKKAAADAPKQAPTGDGATAEPAKPADK